MPKITIVDQNKEIDVPEGTNLRKAALDNGVPLYKGLFQYLNCHGLGTCGSCKVLVKKGMENLSPAGLYEKGRLLLDPFAAIGHENEVRLACLTKVNGDCAIETYGVVIAESFEGENFWQKPYPNK
jgi:ferredoxin